MFNDHYLARSDKLWDALRIARENAPLSSRTIEQRIYIKRLQKLAWKAYRLAFNIKGE